MTRGTYECAVEMKAEQGVFFECLTIAHGAEATITVALHDRAGKLVGNFRPLGLERGGRMFGRMLDGDFAGTLVEFEIGESE